METNQNPLQQYFRSPKVYAELPSKGKYWPDGAIELSASGEIAIFPITAKDEILLKTPDALMNGQAVVDVIQSCIPSIKDAWAIPHVDLEYILIAIRIASYGNTIEIGSMCPECEEENHHDLDLSPYADKASATTFNEMIENDGFKYYMKPLSYKNITENKIALFQEQKRSAQISQLEDNEDKLKLMTEAFQALSLMTYDMVITNVHKIEAPDGSTVDNREHIIEYFNNIESLQSSKIFELMMANKVESELTSAVKCGECEHEYKIPVILDYANFFV